MSSNKLKTAIDADDGPMFTALISGFIPLELSFRQQINKIYLF